jgi:hypothetical protein
VLPPPHTHTHIPQVASWLKGHVSSKYPLVAASTLQASQDAVDTLQVVLPGLLPLGTAAVGECGWGLAWLPSMVWCACCDWLCLL